MKKDAPYYISQGLKKMKDLFTGKQESLQQQDGQRQEQPEEPAQPGMSDYTGWMERVRDGIVRKLPSVVRKVSDYPDRNLLIYINEEGLLGQALEQRLDTYLNDWIELKTGSLMNAVKLHLGTPPAGLLTASVDTWVSIAVERKTDTPSAGQGAGQPVGISTETRAVVTVLRGCCAFSNGSVELVGSREDKTWNIGFGEFDDFGGRKVRMNQIALQYASPEGREKDPYPVSRAHAHISYKPGKGFIFYVDSRGVTKWTAVQKGEKVHRVTNTIAGIILEDGDIIILNREMLLFKIQ